jgi:hypothetical protein
MLSNGSSLSSNPSDGSELSLSTSTPPEDYELINVDDSVEIKTEEYEVAWYSNVSEFSKPKASFDESTEAKVQSVGAAVYLALLRDERGGVAVVKKSF